MDSFSFVGSGIELSNDDVLVVLVEFTEFLPNWGELLAVSAPWSVVLDEDISVRVLDNVGPALSDDDSHWSVV